MVAGLRPPSSPTSWLANAMASQASDLRVAIVGYGLAGSVFHAPLIAATPGLDLTGIVSTNSDRIEQATTHYPGVEIYATAADLWAAGRTDIAVITTPNDSHAPLAHEAIDAGIAVVVDKPLAVDSAQARNLITAAERADVLLTVFQNRRWDGDFRTVAALVEAGRLGRVARFESRFERWRPTLKGGWRESGGRAQGGGLTFDLGPHIIDQALQLFGPAVEVYAEVDTTRAGATADDDVFIALTHHNNVRSHLYASATAADLGPRFRVLGTHGAYVSYGLDPQEAALRADQVPGPGWGEVSPEGWGVLTGLDGVGEPYPTLPGSYPTFYSELEMAVRTGGPAPVNPRESLAALEIIEAALESSKTRNVITLQR